AVLVCSLHKPWLKNIQSSEQPIPSRAWGLTPRLSTERRTDKRDNFPADVSTNFPVPRRLQPTYFPDPWIVKNTQPYWQDVASCIRSPVSTVMLLLFGVRSIEAVFNDSLYHAGAGRLCLFHAGVLHQTAAVPAPGIEHALSA